MLGRELLQRLELNENTSEADKVRHIDVPKARPLVLNAKGGVGPRTRCPAQRTRERGIPDRPPRGSRPPVGGSPRRRRPDPVNLVGEAQPFVWFVWFVDQFYGPL